MTRATDEQPVAEVVVEIDVDTEPQDDEQPQRHKGGREASRKASRKDLGTVAQPATRAGNPWERKRSH